MSKSSRNIFSVLPILTCLIQSTGLAEEPAPSDGLFNPKPENRLREFSSDRPDQTEGPITIDAGHFQLEMDFATFTSAESNGLRTQTWNIAPFNLRIGLLDNLELSLIFGSYLRSHTAGRGAPAMPTLSGAGDFTVRFKVNFWGNDEGQSALGVLPFVKLPTSTGGLGNNSVEGGALLPFSVTLPAGFDLGMETGLGILRNQTGRHYHCEWINSVTCEHRVVGRLKGYCEFFSTVSAETGATWIGTVDLGLVYGVTANVQLDCGCNIGVTAAADDVNAFSGMSIRF